MIKQLWSEWQDHQARLLAVTKKIKAFIAKAPTGRRKPGITDGSGVGIVTAEVGFVGVVLSELGDVSRFRNAKKICAYAGLVPTVRQTGGKKSKDLQSPSKARDCCGGPWSNRPGGWSRPARSGRPFTPG